MNSDIMADNIVDTNSMAGKVVTILIALLFIVVLAFPIANTLGNGSGESGGSDSPVTVSNEQYVLSKMAYGTNPTFEITPTDEESPILSCYKMAVLYADSTNLIYRYSDNESERVYHIITDSFNTLSDATNVSTISTVVSDGQTVTVNYDVDGQSEQYSFDIASPCYYADANGEYGLYINPSVFHGFHLPPGETPPSVGYDSLYIPNDYTPHIIGATALDLNMAYDNGYIFGYTGGSIRNFSTYTTVSNNQITDAGWHYDIRPEGSSWENDLDNHCYFLILPNKVTYTPSNTLDNPEPYSLRYKYAEGTIPDFSIGIATDMQAHTITVTTENGTVTIDATNFTILPPSYVVLATDTSFITPFEAGVIYANEEGTMYVLLNGTIQCANGQLSLIPNGENSILDMSSMTPVSGNVALGTVERCYYADFNGEYGNYFNTQIGSGLYYDSSKPVYSYGLSDNGIVFNDFVIIGDEQISVGSVTSTITTSDNLYTGTTWTGGSLADGETVERYWTILPTSISVDDGGNGGSGVGGVAGTLIKLVPILMIVGLLMMFIVPMVYKPN